MNPIVTVLVTASGRRQWLRTAVESVLVEGKIPRRSEVLVVKDFSDPDLDHWLDAAGVSIFDCKGTVGDMLRLGLEKCTGEIVCFLDDDDLFLPQKLQEVTRVFSARPSLVFYHNGYETIDESGSTVRCRAYRPVRSSLELETGSLKLSKLVSLKYSGHLHNLSSISVRREALTPFLGTIGAIRGTTDCAMFLLAASTNGLLRFDSRLDPASHSSHRS